jgi:hypothetical protein
MTDLVAYIRSLSPEHKNIALEVLDIVTRPLTAREIEAALCLHGIPRSRAAMHANALRKLSIVAVVGEQDHG